MVASWLWVLEARAGQESSDLHTIPQMGPHLGASNVPQICYRQYHLFLFPRTKACPILTVGLVLYPLFSMIFTITQVRQPL